MILCSWTWKHFLWTNVLLPPCGRSKSSSSSSLINTNCYSRFSDSDFNPTVQTVLMSKMLVLISSYSCILLSHGSATFPSASQCFPVSVSVNNSPCRKQNAALKPPAAAAATCVAVRDQFHGTGGEVWQLLALFWGPLVKRRNSSTTPTLHAVRLVRQKRRSPFVSYLIQVN